MVRSCKLREAVLLGEISGRGKTLAGAERSA